MKKLFVLLCTGILAVTLSGCSVMESMLENSESSISSSNKNKDESILEGYEWSADEEGRIFLTRIPDVETLTVVTQVDEKPVYGIRTGKQTFKNLKNLVIPSGISVIYDSAFYECKPLESIIIENGLTEIGASAFSGCLSLTTINLADSIKTIGGEAFMDCGAEHLKLPRELEELGMLAVAASKLTDITIEDGTKYMVEDGWIVSKDKTELLIRTCGPFGERLTGEFIVPDTVEIIGASAFMNETELTGIKLPNGLEKIGGMAFANCTSLTSITVPNSVRNIDFSAFISCKNVTTLDLPSELDSLGENAFQGMTSLTDVVFPAVKEIPNSVMSDCTSLTNLSFAPNNFEDIHIGTAAFAGCPVSGTIEFPDGVTVIGMTCFTKPKNAIFKVPDGLKYAEASIYKSIDIGSNSTIEWRGETYTDYMKFAKSVLLSFMTPPENGSPALKAGDIMSGTITVDTSALGAIGGANGNIVTLKIGDTLETLEKNGFTLKYSDDGEQILGPDMFSAKMYVVSIDDTYKSHSLFEIRVSNTTTESKKQNECPIAEFSGLGSLAGSINYDGFDCINKTREEVISYFGLPQEAYDSQTTGSTYWLTDSRYFTYYDSNLNSLRFNFGVIDKVVDITVSEMYLN